VIEGVAGLAMALMIAASFAGTPDEMGGQAPWLAIAWVLVFVTLDQIVFRFARRKVEALRRGELAAAAARPPRLWPLFVLRLASFGGLSASGWVEGLSSVAAPSALASLALGVSPWLLVYLASQEPRRRLAIARRGRDWPAASWWHLHLRVLLLPLTAVGGLMLLGSLFEGAAGLAQWLQLRPATAFLLSTLATVPLLALVLAPLAARWGLVSRSLAPGPFRDRLEELCRREGFRPRNIRVIETSGHVVNAAFVGFAGPLRYIYFTDGIMEQLGEEELVGVFAHELGHACRRHSLFYLLLILGLSSALTSLSIVGMTAGWSPWLIDLALPLLVFALFFRFVFSPLSKSFETEADLFAVRALGEPEPIARSLEALGRLYPQRVQKGGPLHPGLRDRVLVARRWPVDPAFRAAIAARLARLRWGVVMLAASAFLALLAFLPGEWARAGIVDEVFAASEADDEAQALSALRALEEALQAGEVQDPGHRLRFRLRQIIATHRQDRGDRQGAEEVCREIRQLRGELDEPTQVYSAAIILAQQAAATGDWLSFTIDLGAARRSLPAAEEVLGRDAPGLDQERRDLAWLERGRLLLEAAEILPRTSAAVPRESLGPQVEYRALELLESLRRGASPGSSEGWPQAELEALEERWRLDFLLALKRVIAPR
jgi:Zn-dependent protease with chaperone function